MDEPFQVGADVHVLPTQLAVPGVGTIPVHSFVVLAERPVLVDCGLGVDGPEFLDALRSVIDPADLEWVWLTHDDSDHTGSLQAVMDLAPRARLATHGLGALRMNTWWPVPLDRVHAVAPGDHIDAGDRLLHALRPPTYDNPMSTGIFDDRTATLFPVDTFGAILPAAHHSIDDLSRDELVGGMVAWATFDSPWLHLTDRDRLSRVLEDVRRLGAKRILPSHLPPVVDGVEPLLEVMATIPDADPFVPPDAEAFASIVAGLAASSPG